MISTKSLQFIVRYTKEEKQLIDNYLPFYIDLDKGKRKPNTEKQWHFVRFCRGIDQANTPHESAYLKYKQIKAYEEKQKYKSVTSSKFVKIKSNKKKTTKFNSPSSSSRLKGNKRNKKYRDFDDSPATAREILQAQDQSMKLQASKRFNVRKAMVVHSDPRD